MSGAMSTPKSGSSLLGCVASRLAPLLMMARREDPEAVLRHLQIASTEFIYRFSEHDPVLTPYTFSNGQKQEDATDNSADKTALEVSSSSTPVAVHGEFPLQTALCFRMGENKLENQKHLFELSIFRELLRRPRQYYAHAIFWTALIEKLEELDLYQVLQRNITKFWEVIKEQHPQQRHHTPEVLNGLRALRLSCDIMLFFSEHSMRVFPKAEVLRELVTLTQQMWMDGVPLVVKRCAVVMSVFLAKYPSLLPLDKMCSHQAGQDAPHFLAVLASVPALSENSSNKPEVFHRALEVVFTTTVYSIPTATYFRDDGSSYATLQLVKKCFASVLYQLFARVSGEFWRYFSRESLISAVEGVAIYAYMWDSFPSGMLALQRYIRDDTMAEESSIYALSLFNFYTAASASYLTLDDLKNCGGLLMDDAPHRATHEALPLREDMDKAENESVQPHDAYLSEMMTAAEPPVNKTFRLLMMRWNSMHDSDKVFMRSGLVLLQALMYNYSHQLMEVEEFIGCDIQSLLYHVFNAVLTEHVSNVRLVEVICNTISRFHGLVGNISHVVSKLLLPNEMKEVGMCCEAAETALLQLRLFGRLLEAHTGDAPPGRKLAEVVMHILPGIISCHSLELVFFVDWLSIAHAALLDASWSAASLISFEELSDKLIHRLCEGIFVFIREMQTGNVFLGDSLILAHLEVAIHLLSHLVFECRRHDSLATCVVATHGESTLSACLMLYCLVFASNATSALVESTAKLLVHVVEHSHEKLFTTIRFHTATKLKRMLLLAVHQRLMPPTTPFVSRMNVVRLASLSYLLRFDPASFYYLVVPEELEKNSSELELARILRDVVKCRTTTPLEKAEAFELLRALDDASFSITETVSLLENTECGLAYTKCAFTAAVINYVCGALLGELNADVDRVTRASEKGQHQGSCRYTAYMVRSKTIASHLREINGMMTTGCEALKQCCAFYKEARSGLRSPSDCGDASFATQRPSKGGQQLALLRTPTTATATATAMTMMNEVSSFVSSSSHHYALPVPREHTKPKALLLGDGFLLSCKGGDDVCLNRMASALESITRLVTSLEALVWLVHGEKEASFGVLTLLEVVLDGIQIVEPVAEPLGELMYACTNGWLALARAATVVFAHTSADSVLVPSTTKLNPLFQNILRLAAWNRENVDVVYQALSVLSLFQPSDVYDEKLGLEIFELIADVLERHRTAVPSSSLSALIAEVTAMYNHLGSFCPVHCLISTLDSLWSCATRVLHLIPANETNSLLSDFFDHIVDALCSALLHWEDAPKYFQPKRVMVLANALGQLTHTVFCDPSTNLCRPKALHQVWQSVLRLLHTVLVSTDRDGTHYTEWLTSISALVTTSPRFKCAVSGFSLSDPPRQKSRLFAWELHEMHLCTSIVTLLASFGVSTVAVTQCVQRGFCLIRRCSVQTVVAPDGVLDERALGHLLVLTVRLQLSYFIQLPTPPVYAEGGPILVTIDRYRVRSPGGNASIAGNNVIPQRLDSSDEGVGKEEEQFSFDMLRTFILRDLNIIRKSHCDRSRSAGVSFSPERTPSLHSSFETASGDSAADVDVREGYSLGIGPHVDNVQLALVLFLRYARFHISTRNLRIWERQELTVGLEKLFHALSWLIHDVRRLENTKLTWVLETVRVELQSLAESLHSGL